MKPLAIYLLGLILTISAQAGTPDQDPLIAWARDSFSAGSVPTDDQLAMPSVWSCQIASAIKDQVSFGTAVKVFKFEKRGSKGYRNILKFKHEIEINGRHYKPDEYDSNLNRDVMWGWYYSLERDWANPETPVPFRNYETIRYHRTRLIVERSVTVEDLRKLSENHHDADVNAPAYVGVPSIARVSADRRHPDRPDSRLIAFQYLICDHPKSQAPESAYNEQPRPDLNDWISEVGRYRPDLAQQVCLAGYRLEIERTLHIELGQGRWLALGDEWFTDGQTLRRGAKGTLAPEMEQRMRDSGGFDDHNGGLARLEPGQTYPVVSVRGASVCRGR